MIFNLNFSVIVVFPGKRIGAEQKAATYHSCTNMQDDSLTRLTVDERSVAYKGAMPSKTGKRASDKGFLGMSFELYLKLLDWTGRQIRRDAKKGRIPAELAPIMERIGLTGELWCDVVKRFGKIFKRVAGTPESLAQEAIRRGRSGFRTGSSPIAKCRLAILSRVR